MERIVNPAIPYVGHIIGNFTTGKTMVIEGMVIFPSQRIVINFQTGKNISHKDDIALQMSCRLLEGKIARNSVINGLLGTEEISGLYPLTVGQRFKITVKNELQKYVVTVNDKGFSFRHRLPSSRVNHISIQGDVKLFMIEYESNVSQGDNFRPIYDEPPPPYTPYPETSQPKDSTEEPSVLDSVLPLAVGTGLGAIGTALFSNLAGRSSQNTQSHGQNCKCSTCSKERSRANQGQQQQQQSSGWGAFGAGLATVAALAAGAGLVYSLTKDSNKDDSDED